MKSNDRLGRPLPGIPDPRSWSVRRCCLPSCAAVWFCTIQLFAICAVADTATPVANAAAKLSPPVTTTATAVAVSAVPASAPAAPVKSQDQELWEQLRQAEMTGTSDTLADWAVINGMPLAPKVEGIDAEFSAVASVLMYLDTERFPYSRLAGPKVFSSHRYPRFDIDSDAGTHLLAYHPLFTSIMASGDKETIGRKWGMVLSEFHEKNKKAWDKRDDNWLVEEKRMGRKVLCPPCGPVLVRYLRDFSADPSKAVKAYWAQRFCQCPERRLEMNVNYAKMLLNCKIPFLFKAGQDWRVCFGYIEHKTGDIRFLVADASQGKITYMNQSGSMFYVGVCQLLLDALSGIEALEAFDELFYVSNMTLAKGHMFAKLSSYGEMIVLFRPVLATHLVYKKLEK